MVVVVCVCVWGGGGGVAPLKNMSGDKGCLWLKYGDCTYFKSVMGLLSSPVMEIHIPATVERIPV